MTQEVAAQEVPSLQAETFHEEVSDIVSSPTAVMIAAAAEISDAVTSVAVNALPAEQHKSPSTAASNTKKVLTKPNLAIKTTPELTSANAKHSGKAPLDTGIRGSRLPMQRKRTEERKPSSSRTAETVKPQPNSQLEASMTGVDAPKSAEKQVKAGKRTASASTIASNAAKQADSNADLLQVESKQAAPKVKSVSVSTSRSIHGTVKDPKKLSSSSVSTTRDASDKNTGSKPTTSEMKSEVKPFVFKARPAPKSTAVGGSRPVSAAKSSSNESTKAPSGVSTVNELEKLTVENKMLKKTLSAYEEFLEHIGVSEMAQEHLKHFN